MGKITLGELQRVVNELIGKKPASTEYYLEEYFEPPETPSIARMPAATEPKLEPSTGAPVPTSGKIQDMDLDGTPRHEDGSTGIDDIKQSQVDSLLRSIQRMLRENTRASWKRDKDYGKLDGKSLWKYRTGGRLFQQKTAYRRGYDIHMLIDVSGSMFPFRAISAAWMAGALGMALAKIEHVTVSASKFNRKYWDLDVHAPLWHHNIAVHEEDNSTGGNHDGPALKRATVDLLKRSNPRNERIMIVLSDGEPSCGGCSEPATCPRKMDPKKSDHEALLDAVRWVRSTPVHLIGIGCESSAVKAYYPNHAICHSGNNSEVLARQLTLGISKTLSRIITRRT